MSEGHRSPNRADDGQRHFQILDPNIRVTIHDYLLITELEKKLEPGDELLPKVVDLRRHFHEQVELALGYPVAPQA